jgi:hypothetical protein
MRIVITVELEFCLQWDTICQTALQALLDRVTWRVDIVVDELQNEIVSGVCDGEILLKHFVKALVLTILGRSVHLKEITE